MAVGDFSATVDTHDVAFVRLTQLKSDDSVDVYQFPFQDPALDWDLRTHDLVSRLSLAEKGAQLGHYNVSDPTKSLGRANSPAIPRLNISGCNYGEECNSGVIVGFPQNVGMAATFNRSAIFHAGQATGRGLRARSLEQITDPFAGSGPGDPGPQDGLSCWAPMINLVTHPLWGPSFALSTRRYPFVWRKGVLNGYSSTRVSLWDSLMFGRVLEY